MADPSAKPGSLGHSHATILRKARVDLGTVQKALGHSSPEITARIFKCSIVNGPPACVPEDDVPHP